MKVPFSTVLVYLEERDWVLQKIYRKSIRVFVRGNDESPILIQVDDDGNVDKAQFDAIKPLAD
jgi:hypothetical protein